MAMILVFGAGSFVARNIEFQNKLSRQDCDLTKYDEIIAVLKYHNPSSVISCAAAHGSSKLMSVNHSHYLDHNLIMDSNLLRACNTLNIENVVLLSSISAFPEVENRDVVESDLFNGAVNKFNFGYNTAKRFSYSLCKAYNLDYQRNYKVLFLGNLYGKFGNFSNDSNVLNSVIYNMFNAKKLRQNLNLYGTGEDQRAFTFVEDLNQILEPFINNTDLKSAIFSSDEVYSILEISKIVALKMNYKGEIIFTGEKSGSQIRKVSSSKYLKNNFSDLRFTSLDIGLDKVVNWYSNSHYSS